MSLNPLDTLYAPHTLIGRSAQTFGVGASIAPPNATTVAAGSNGVNTSTFTGSGTLHAAAGNGPAGGGVLTVATGSTPAIISYTSISGADYLGCTTLSGGGALATGGAIVIKSAWVQATTSTAEDTYKMRVFVDTTATAATDTSTLLDIAVGALGSEVVIVPNLLVGYWRNVLQTGGSASSTPNYYDIPIFIPKGTRIAARAQSANGAAGGVGATIDLYGRSTLLGAPFAGAAIDAIGPATLTSHGAAVTPGLSGATGAWTELISATTARYRAFLIGMDGGGGSVMTSANVALDIATGASGSEQLLVPQNFVQISVSSSETVDFRNPTERLIGLTQPLPSGSRLAVRATQSTASQATPFGVALYGIR